MGSKQNQLDRIKECQINFACRGSNSVTRDILDSYLLLLNKSFGYTYR